MICEAPGSADITNVSRRLALILLVALAVPALALAANSDPKREITSADEARAASIVLKRTDLSRSWKRTTSLSSDRDLTCSFYHPDGSDLTMSGDAKSAFERVSGMPSILSYADVYTTAKDAAASWSRTVKPALARCAAKLLQDEFGANPAGTLKILRQGAIPFPRVAPRTAAFRVGLVFSTEQAGETVKVPLTLHIVVVGRGRTEAGMLTFAPGPGVAAGDLHPFARLLSERMKRVGD